MRICTVMVFTDGTHNRYAVMIGKMSGRAFNAHNAEVVATYDSTEPPSDRLYAELAAKHATPQCPPVYWQRSK